MACLSRFSRTQAVIVTAIVLTTEGARASCNYSEVIMRPEVVSTDQTLTSAKNEACSFLLNSTRVEFVKVKIARQPSHGVAGANNSVGAHGYAYKPAQGFVGKDHFVVAVDVVGVPNLYRPSRGGIERIPGSAAINVDVEVGGR
jgi:hypothetical protein